MLYKQRNIFSCSSLFPHFVHSELSSYRCNNHSQCCPKNNLVNLKHLREKKAMNLCSEFIQQGPWAWQCPTLVTCDMMPLDSWCPPYKPDCCTLLLRFPGGKKTTKSLGVVERNWNTKNMWVFPGIWLLHIPHRMVLYITKCLLWSLFSFQINAMIPITMIPCSLVIVRTYIDHGV